MIIDGKEYKISEYFNISNLNDDNIDYLIIQLNDIKSITNISYMFHCCESLISLLDISRWNNSNITDMSYMFCGCSSLISLPDISKWNTSKVTNIYEPYV